MDKNTRQLYAAYGWSLDWNGKSVTPWALHAFRNPNKMILQQIQDVKPAVFVRLMNQLNTSDVEAETFR
jgi:hypothetical protein